MPKQTAGHIRIISSSYTNLAQAEGQVLVCTIEDVGDGDKLYHVHPDKFKDLGCDVGVCRYPYPFYADEVEVIEE